MINGVFSASSSTLHGTDKIADGIPWLLYWISFKFVALSGAMLIAPDMRARG